MELADIEESMFTLGFFLLTSGIFLVFFILITIFGYFFQYHIFKTFKSKKFSLAILLESFVVGTAIYIFYSYITIDFRLPFSFILNYLPIIIFDAINVAYFIWGLKHKDRKELKEIFANIKNKFLNKRIKTHLIIVFVSIVLFLIIQAIMETDLSLPAKDPYNWFNSIAYLHKYGDFDYDSFTTYGMGFVIFDAGALLITNDYYIIYFFIKYNPIFFFILLILIIYNISKKIFKENLEIFATLIVLLCFNSLLYRFSLCVPSTLATILGLIFINTLFEKDNSRIMYIRGFLLGGILLIHVLYFAIFFGFFFIFELYNLIFILKRSIKLKEKKNSVIIFSFLKKYGIYVLILAILFVPYIMNLMISEENIMGIIERYLYRRYAPDSLIYYSFPIVIAKSAFLLDVTPSSSNLLFNIIFVGFDIPINKTLGWGVIFIVIGLFFTTKWNTSQKKYLIEFIKFSFILSFLIFIFISFLFTLNNKLIFSIASFTYHKGKRVFELFSPLWSILFVFGIKTIFKLFKKYTIKRLSPSIIKIKKEFYLIKKKINKKYFISLLIIIGILYSYHLYLHYNVIYTNYYKDDDLTEAVLFVGDYCSEKDIEDEKILVPKLSNSYIYSLILQKDVDLIKYKYADTSYSELVNVIDTNETKYVLIDKEEAKSSCIDQIVDNMKILYENHQYMFFKVE